ncbi:MAG TPA: 3-dehydroquinate synthase [Polyangiaceae bacterium]|nr:3-dehydroquinate synthase [Polyangiaceae bacterium]
MSKSPLSGFRPSLLHEQRFSVDFDYPVVFCRGALAPAEPTLAWSICRREPERRQPVFAVLDGGLVAARPGLAATLEQYIASHGHHLALCAPPYVMPGGEECKNDPRLVADLHDKLAAARLDKQGTLLIIGGGAVLDAAGYAGSTTHRGVRIVRMPTTVLSQNDAGVGVKTSVNAFGAKNFLGTFAPPFAVINDTELLATLPVRDVCAGLAEAVKVALIRDASFFDWLEQHAPALRDAEPNLLETAVRRCAELHLRHIATGGDPFERGSARPLDYGHWAAHKLETLSQHALRHGEAVAIGMALDAAYAVEKAMLSEAVRTRLCALLRALGLPIYDPILKAQRDGRSLVVEGLQEFREHLGGALSVTLLTNIGRGVEVMDMDLDVIARSIDWLESHQD